MPPTPYYLPSQFNAAVQECDDAVINVLNNGGNIANSQPLSDLPAPQPSKSPNLVTGLEKLRVSSKGDGTIQTKRKRGAESKKPPAESQTPNSANPLVEPRKSSSINAPPEPRKQSIANQPSEHQKQTSSKPLSESRKASGAIPPGEKSRPRPAASFEGTGKFYTKKCDWCQ